VDESVDLRDAKRRVGKRVALFGNVSVDTIYRGTRAEIEGNVEKCITSAGSEGYIVSSSCGLHAGTPIENLKVMVNAGKKMGAR